jgi:hypothetical protein
MNSQTCRLEQRIDERRNGRTLRENEQRAEHREEYEKRDEPQLLPGLQELDELE